MNAFDIGNDDCFDLLLDEDHVDVFPHLYDPTIQSQDLAYRYGTVNQYYNSNGDQELHDDCT